MPCRGDWKRRLRVQSQGARIFQAPYNFHTLREDKTPSVNAGRYPKRRTPAIRVLEEWRGLPTEVRPDRASCVGEVLEKLLPKLGIHTRIKEADIQNAWSGIVGEFIAKHSRPERLVSGHLQVRVIQSSVRYELDRVWKPEIIRKLRERFGEQVIRDIKFIL